LSEAPVGGPRRSSGGPLRRHAPILACAILYLALAVANGIVWENAHDEGFTFAHAIGDFHVSDRVAAPDPLTDLYATLDARSGFSSRDVIRALTEMLGGGMHPPGYYLFMNQWAQAFGTGRLTLRLPAYLAGLLSLFGISLLARRLVPGPGAAWGAPLLLAVSPWFVGFSNYVRPYAMALCIALWSTLALLELSSGRQRARWRVAFVVLTLLGLYAIYHSVFVLAWQSVLLALIAWRRGSSERWRDLGGLAAMGAVVVAGFLVWIPSLLEHLEVVRTSDLYFKTPLPPSQWPSAAASALLTFSLGEAADLRLFFTRAGERLDDAARLTWWTLPLLPLLVMAGDALLGSQTLFITKTSFTLLPLLILVVVRAWSAVPSRALRVAGLAAWSLVLVASLVGNLYVRAASTTDFEHVARDLRGSDSRSQVVLVSSTLPGYLVPMLLSLRDVGVHESRMLHAPPTRLLGMVDALARDPAVKRLSLVNLKVTYGGPSLQRTQTWSPQQLRRVLHRVEALGWQVRPAGGGVGPTEGEGERILSVAPAVYVKYFSM
jgi:hypothetical protein